METRLQFIFSNVNEWLKFAENKNAALLAANSAVLFALIRVVSSQTFAPLLQFYTFIVILLLLFSAGCCLISFIPSTRFVTPSPDQAPKPEDNLLFYGDISHYETRSYLHALYDQEGQKPEKFPQVEEDYAEQIITNSRIALWKYNWFAVALWLALTAILTPIVSITFFFLRKKA